MTQAQDYVIDTGHGQVAEGVWEVRQWQWFSVGTKRDVFSDAFMRVTDDDPKSPAGFTYAHFPTGQLITGAGL